ncbi:hypothetical protein [Agrobacterium genomosp. 13]|uniref:hypothetical protein n=1 Tax=Agrobacterium genomosp. 13 TaxID=1183419 RepID=UPI00111A62DB|nr:hypothetical protein [Agrobacterium genomosp. 13]
MRIFMKTFPFVDASKVCSSTLSANVECFFDLVALKICTADSSRNGLVPEIYSLSVFFRCENDEGRMGKKAIGAGTWKNNNRSMSGCLQKYGAVCPNMMQVNLQMYYCNIRFNNNAIFYCSRRNLWSRKGLLLFQFCRKLGFEPKRID